MCLSAGAWGSLGARGLAKPAAGSKLSDVLPRRGAAVTVAAPARTLLRQYTAVSACGYLALGDSVPASILLGFDAAHPAIVLMANFMVSTVP